MIRALYQTLHRYLCGVAGEDPQELRILLYAPSGSAAYNIGGLTIHKAFNIQANNKLEYKDLPSDQLNTLKVRYRKLSVLIIDEISMVSSQMLNIIHMRLMKLKGSKKPFGGVHVILVGDLFQLKPVFGSWVFKHPDNSTYETLAPNLWTENFSIYELTEIMRQKEDRHFAELLNRLGEGKHTKKGDHSDLATLKACIVNENESNKTAQHFFRSRRDVADHNEKIFAAAMTDKTSIYAHDAVVGDTHKTVQERIK